MAGGGGEDYCKRRMCFEETSTDEKEVSESVPDAKCLTAVESITQELFERILSTPNTQLAFDPRGQTSHDGVIAVSCHEDAATI